MQASLLPLPDYYRREQAGDYHYEPDPFAVFSAADEMRRRHSIRAGGAKGVANVTGVIIDGQKSFCFPPKMDGNFQVSGGSLYVAGRSGTGAIDDCARTAEFMYRYADVFRQWRTTLDTHFAQQIFFCSTWVNADGAPLAPHSMVTLGDDGKTLLNVTPAGDVLFENVKPNPRIAWAVANGNYGWLQKQWKFYCEKLKEGGKYTLYLWPFHCLLGTSGHALAGTIQAATQFHAFLRGAQNHSEIKGGNPHTENYSVFSPEVLERFDGRPLAQKNAKLIQTLLESDAVVMLGQAGSHCVASSIGDFLGEIKAQDPDLAKKVYVVQDCMSAVTVPDGSGGIAVDFTPQMEDALQEFADAGMHVVESTTPIDQWPDFPAV